MTIVAINMYVMHVVSYDVLAHHVDDIYYGMSKMNLLLTPT